jgi:hypothetical protein
VATQRQALKNLKKSGSGKKAAPVAAAAEESAAAGNGRKRRKKRSRRRTAAAKKAALPAEAQPAAQPKAAPSGPIDLIDRVFDLADECGGFEQLKRLVDRMVALG